MVFYGLWVLIFVDPRNFSGGAFSLKMLDWKFIPEFLLLSSMLSFACSFVLFSRFFVKNFDLSSFFFFGTALSAPWGFAGKFMHWCIVYELKVLLGLESLRCLMTFVSHFLMLASQLSISVKELVLLWSLLPIFLVGTFCLIGVESCEIVNLVTFLFLSIVLPALNFVSANF